ncbi:hypothetical protein MH117_01655 [Paenibacillus sp. ACRRX]|uniref:hypothetical protein n=1 Tax=Paenibacillus sp. ACRRX TaxID=2918206 RepID=UPI001EF4D5CD|nr:hypothetical protein [Paenibacillus sp. ACRRX]MCG7406104.1 hypothetical protein [Paenibacillus sp. ACRRX]
MRRKVGIVLVIILLIGAIAVWWGYEYITNREVSTQELGVATDFFDFSKVDTSRPVGGVGTIHPDQSISGSPQPTAESAANSGEQTGKRSQQEQLQTEGAQQPISGDGRTQAPITEESIRSRYIDWFESLQATAISRLDVLGKRAKADYKLYKAGKSNRSLADLTSLYMSAAKKLERNVDKSFYSRLEQMKSELKEHGFGIQLAEEAEAAYRAKIDHKKSQLMDKAVGKLK